MSPPATGALSTAAAANGALAATGAALTAGSNAPTGGASTNGSVAGPAADRLGRPPSNSPVSTKPTERTNMASAASSTVGSFFGHAGVFETIALEMTRASAGAAPILSRAVASRYLAR